MPDTSLVPIARLYERLAEEGITTRRNAHKWWSYKVKTGAIPQLFAPHVRKRIQRDWIEQIVRSFTPGGPYCWHPSYDTAPVVSDGTSYQPHPR